MQSTDDAAPTLLRFVLTKEPDLKKQTMITTSTQTELTGGLLFLCKEL